MTDIPETSGKGKAPSRVEPVTVDPSMKTAVEEAVTSALRKIPGLEDLLSPYDTHVPLRPYIQTLQNSDVAGSLLHGKYTKTQVFSLVNVVVLPSW